MFNKLTFLRKKQNLLPRKEQLQKNQLKKLKRKRKIDKKVKISSYN